MTNEELQKLLTSFEKEVGNIPQWKIDKIDFFRNIERTDSWRKNISKSTQGRKINNKVKKQISNKIITNNKSLSEKEKVEKFSNESSSKKSLMIRKEVLNLITTDEFTTTDARLACEKYGLKNWKFFLRDTRIIEQTYKGTNQFNPSKYKKKI